MSTPKVAFLINHKAGSRGTGKQRTDLMKHLKGRSGMSVYETQTPEEMLELSRDLAQKNYEAIFACGGDGTLNLVSSQLIGTETALAIIPLGSGNGYARHHKIPLQWNEALKVIDHPRRTLRDTGVINNLYFLNIAGIGYAAKISHAFHGAEKRGMLGYTRTVAKNLKMEAFHARVSNENSSWEGDTWMVDFCNGSQWGNNFRISPGSRDDDGSLSAVIFKKINPLKLPVLGFHMATKKMDKSPDVVTMAGAGFIMEFEGKRPLHIDGEPAGFAKKKAEVQILPKSLWVWTP
ncbi:MAG: hypothetical protein JNL57_11500 [Bacteroidetes bacterium]|nr:hypothetical protein [Bacteroidota bacterium]